MTSPDQPDLAIPPSSRRRRPRRASVGLGAGALAVAVVVGGYAVSTTGDRTSRQAEVKRRGTAVMPFDLDRTRHVFTDLPDGGEQTVTALASGDADQVRFIREHLQREEAKFRAGDFGDPAAIHGAEMPGLAELKAGTGRITVTYTALGDGARLQYTTSEPTLVQGIHSWFRAQSTDHGTDDGHTP